MKRILSLILALTFVLSFIPVLAENTVQKSEITEDIDNMLGVLKMTGIVDEDFVVIQDVMTRGQFAALLVKSKGMNNFLGLYENSSFIDITDGTNFAKEISLAKDMGLISGYSDGTFRPNNNTSIMEAAICFIRVLGYNVKAEALGGYPTGYYEIIRETGLLKNINKGYNELLTYEDAVKIVYNALHTKVMKPTGVSNEGTEYKVQEDLILLNDAFGYYFVEGVVNGIDITNLVGENDLPPYTVLIGDIPYYTGSYDLRNLLGYNVRAYYNHEYVGEKIKFAFKTNKKNNENIINIPDIMSIENGKLITEDLDGNRESYSYNENAPVIYNGTNTSEEFNTKIYNDANGKRLNGTVKLIDNNGDKKADVVVINAYVNLIVGRIDDDEQKVYDFYDTSSGYILNTEADEPYVCLFDSKNEEASFEDIESGMSLVIYDSKADAYQQYTKVYISKKTAAGKITCKETVNGTIFVTIDDEETYPLSQYAEDNISDVIVGRTIDAKINYCNEIAEIKYQTNPGDYSLAMLMAGKKQSGFEGEFIVKFMGIDGTFSTIALADKVKIDNNVYVTSSENNLEKILARFKKGAEVCQNTPFGNYFFQMIKYGIDTNGKINYIDTVLDERESPELEKMTAENCRINNEIYAETISGKYFNSTGMVDQKVLIGKTTKVFMYPSEGNETDELYYDIRDNKYFVDATDYSNLVAIRDTKNGYSASLFMRQYFKKDIADSQSNMITSMVTGVTEAINSNGEPCTKLYLYQRGTNLEVYAPNDLVASLKEVAPDGTETSKNVSITEVAPGDIIYCATNTITGEVEAFALYYSKKNNILYGTKGTNKCEVAYIIDSTDDGIKFVYEDDANNGIDVALEAGKYKVFNNLKLPITLYDTSKNKARIASHYDLTSYIEDAANYSKVIIRIYASQNNLIREMYIYK